MEENKEILTNESETNTEDKGYDLKTFEENTEAETSENNNESATEERLDSEIESVCAACQTKKEPILQKTIIISIAILLAFLASFLVVKCFFNTSVVGTWVFEMEDTASPDQATLGEKETFDVYYTFTADGEVITTNGSAKTYTTYTLAENAEGNPTMTTGLFSGITVDYRVEGNAITGRKLIISLDGEDVFKFNSAHLVDVKPEVSKDFKANEKLLGKWSDGSGVYEDYYYNVYEFKADGTCDINAAQYDPYTGAITPINIKASYSFADDKIKISYKMIDENSQLQDVADEFIFSFDEENDVFVMNGLGFYRINDDNSFVSTPDQIF